MAESARAGRNSEGGDVTVVGEVVWVLDAGGRGLVGLYWGFEGRGLKLA